jgi:methylamine dehydrogenase heavy chain
MKPINRILNSVPRPSKAIACAGIATIVAAGLAGAAFAQKETETKQPSQIGEKLLQKTQDEVTIEKLPPPGVRRVYVNDPRAFETFTQQMAIDGQAGAYKGTLDVGLLTLLVTPPDNSKLYVADTHYSDYSYGKRNDLIRVYDPRTLLQIGEIDIPESRFLAMGVSSYTHISPDGNYLVWYSFVPTNGVGIVDLKAGKYGKYLATLDAPNCYYAFPATNRRVVMHCRNGSLLQMTFDKNGKMVKKTSTKPFHHPLKQPTFDDVPYDRQTGQLFFISLWGEVFPVNISGNQPKPGKSWSLLTDSERKANWKPTGWQVAAYNPKNKRLYVLMDKRARWSQHAEARNVWVYDTTNGKKVKEINLHHEGRSIHVDQGSPSYLYVLSSHHANLQIINAQTGHQHALIDTLGHEPNLIAGHGPSVQ